MAGQLSLCSPKTTQAGYCPGRAQRGKEKLSISSSDDLSEERPDLTVSNHKQQKVGIVEQTEDWLHIRILFCWSWLDQGLSSAWRVQGLLLEDCKQTQSTFVCNGAQETWAHTVGKAIWAMAEGLVKPSVQNTPSSLSFDLHAWIYPGTEENMVSPAITLATGETPCLQLGFYVGRSASNKKSSQHIMPLSPEGWPASCKSVLWNYKCKSAMGKASWQSQAGVLQYPVSREQWHMPGFMLGLALPKMGKPSAVPNYH